MTEEKSSNIRIGPRIRIPVSILILALIALALRSVGLDIKPSHFDEGINGHFVRQMWQDGFYRYDPTNFHGPLYFYYLQLAQLLMGEGLFTFRFATGLISVGIVILLAELRRFFGGAAIWAAVFVTFSPAFVFYSRYAIHESLFVFLNILFVYGYLVWREEKSRLSYILMLTGVLGSFATKETFFIFFATWAIAIVATTYATKILPRWFPAPAPSLSLPRPPAKKGAELTHDDAIALFLLGCLIVVMLFTGFFMNDRGLSAMFEAYAAWTHTGVQGTGHEKPFFYWIKLLSLYEWPSLLGLAATPLVFWYGSTRERWVALTAFGTWLAYSIIPYKTPWFILNQLWPMALVTGILLVRFPKKIILPLVTVALLFSTKEMLRLNFKDPTKASEPYVYVQSTLEFKAAMDTISERVKKFPEDLNMKVMILSREAWPMPWIFQDYPSLVYGQVKTADLSGADVIFIDAINRAELETKLVGKYWVEPLQIRDSYEKGFVFYEFEKFKGLVPASSALFEKAASSLSAPAPEPSATPLPSDAELKVRTPAKKPMPEETN